MSTGQPRHQIAGTGHRVHGPGNAADLNSIVAGMRYAIRACDRTRFEEGQARLRTFSWGPGGGLAEGFQRGIADTFGGGRDHHDRIVAQRLLEELKFPLDCGQPQTVGIQPSASGGAGNVHAPPTSYFGLRNPITGDERIGALSPNANTYVTTVGASFRIDFTNVVRFPGLPGGPRLDFAYSQTRGNENQNFLTFDPLGQVLLLPGAQDPGFALTAGVPPGTPGGFNVVEGIFYNRAYRSDAFHFTIEQPVLQTGRVSVSALAGLNYSRTSIDERLDFAIPGFLSSGAYHSSLDLFTFTPTFGGGVYVAVGETSPGQTVIYGKAAVGPALTRAGGTDRFNMSGFINTNQAADLSGNHTGFFGSFTGGVRVAVGDFFGDGSVTYVTSDSFGNVVRTGQTGETSQVDFVRGDATTFKFTFGAKFGGGVRVPATDFNRQRP